MWYDQAVEREKSNIAGKLAAISDEKLAAELAQAINDLMAVHVSYLEDRLNSLAQEINRANELS